MMKKSGLFLMIALGCLLIMTPVVLAQSSMYYYPQTPGYFPGYAPQMSDSYPQTPGYQTQNPGYYPQMPGYYPQNSGSYPQTPGYAQPYAIQPGSPWGTQTPCFSYGTEQLYQCGLQLVYAKRYNEAVQVFQMFLQSYPQSSLADNALYWTGECYYAQKRYYEALSYFQRVLYTYPRGNKVPDAMLKTALSYFSMKRNSEGCRALNYLVTRYPNSESARKAYRWFDRCGWNQGNSYSQPQTPYYYNDWTFPKNY